VLEAEGWPAGASEAAIAYHRDLKMTRALIEVEVARRDLDRARATLESSKTRAVRNPALEPLVGVVDKVFQNAKKAL
jgi:hypothetical protein